MENITCPYNYIDYDNWDYPPYLGDLLDFCDEELFFCDEYGVCYTIDGKVLVSSCRVLDRQSYTVRNGCEIICDEAFEYDGGWKEAMELPKVDLILPDTVRIIGHDIIRGRTNITNLCLPEWLEVCGVSNYIDVWNFKSASSRFVIKNGLLMDGDKLISVLFTHMWELKQPIRVIGSYAFRGFGMQWFRLPNTIEEIESYGFSENRYLRGVTLPEGLKTLGSYAFESCGSLEKIVVPTNIKKIAAGTFIDCISLKEVMLPEELETIEEYAFSNCQKLETICLPNGVKKIGECAFKGCRGLKDVVLPEGLETIDDYAFVDCRSLETIRLPQSVKTIGKCAFKGCGELKEVILPEGLETIGIGVFGNCDNLQVGNLPNTYTVVNNLLCNDGKVIGLIGSPRHVVVPEGIISIADEAFANIWELHAIELPSTLREIGRRAFVDTNIAKIIVPEGITTIPQSAFASCDSLEEIHLPDSLMSIEANAFDRCSELLEIRIPKNVRSIGDSAFCFCRQLKKVWYETDEGLTNVAPKHIVMGKDVFKYCFFLGY